MRKRAFILILPFTVFLTETVSFVPALQDACTKATSKESSCCMITDEPAKKECSSENTGEKESPANDCTENPDCSTCPVCYTFIFQPRYEWPEQDFVFKKSYALLKASYSSSYTCNVWKPPNGSLIPG